MLGELHALQLRVLLQVDLGVPRQVGLAVPLGVLGLLVQLVERRPGALLVVPGEDGVGVVLDRVDRLVDVGVGDREDRLEVVDLVAADDFGVGGVLVERHGTPSVGWLGRSDNGHYRRYTVRAKDDVCESVTGEASLAAGRSSHGFACGTVSGSRSCCVAAGRSGHGFACQVQPLSRRTRGVEDRVLLLDVDRVGAGRRAARLVAAHPQDGVALGELLGQPVLREGPGAHVGRLLLQPHDLARRPGSGPRSRRAARTATGRAARPARPPPAHPACRARPAPPGRPCPSTARCGARRAGSADPGSSSTSWNEPLVRSSIGERAGFARSSDLGVKTTSGLRTSRTICRRSRWKYCAAVVALATWMLSSAHSVRNRSMRAELCSGPWPS